MRLSAAPPPAGAHGHQSPKSGIDMNLSSNKTLAGVIIGVVIAFFVMFGGWLGLLWLLLFTIVGGVIGAQLDGRLDIAEILSTSSGKGRS
ncbi:hypothetical protein CHAD_01695 [Corynebacterium hadale]|nr:hypothetical protein CHAD_01695 [Corynebacterium hadale]